MEVLDSVNFDNLDLTTAAEAWKEERDSRVAGIEMLDGWEWDQDGVGLIF